MKNYIISLIGLIGLPCLIVTSGCESPTTSSEESNPFIKVQSFNIDATHEIDYWLLLPECFDSTQAYPAVLALPPGSQSVDLVAWAINLYYIRQSIQRNWLVISPVAPGGIQFHEGAETLIPLLLNEIEEKYHIEGGKYHLAGISNGGISAFRLGIMYPERFQSLTVFPGVPTEHDKTYLKNLSNIPVTMYVGAADAAEWIEETEQTVQTLDSLGVAVEYKKWENNGHVITSLTPAYLFDLLDSYRTALTP